MVKRLKGVNLMITSLMTSLHDTTILGLNHGFQEASSSFKRLINDTQEILSAVNNDTDIKNILKILDIAMEILTDNSLTITGLTLAGVTITFIVILAVVMIKQNRDLKLVIKEATEKIQECEAKERERDTQ